MDLKKLSFVLLLATLGTTLTAQDTLTVGVKPAPPFIIENENGTYSGVSVDLWENMAGKMDVEYDLVPYDLPNLLAALKEEKIDLSINPLTVTSDRMKEIDFSQPFFITSLAIATHKKTKASTWKFLQNFFSTDFWFAVLGLFLVVFIFAVLEWIFERKKNEEEFGPGLKGIWQAVWWSAVTMTTVGYGDKSPRTTGGRIVALVWMFTAIIIISSFTASIASSLTVNQLSYDISGPNDLRNYATGTVEASSSAKYLTNIGIAYKTYDTPSEGLQAMREGELDAFVYDRPILQHLINRERWEQDLTILENTFYKQYYSFSFPKTSTLEEEVNLLLLDEINGVEWKSILNKYNLTD